MLKSTFQSQTWTVVALLIQFMVLLILSSFSFDGDYIATLSKDVNQGQMIKPRPNHQDRAQDYDWGQVQIVQAKAKDWNINIVL